MSRRSSGSTYKSFYSNKIKNKEISLFENYKLILEELNYNFNNKLNNNNNNWIESNENCLNFLEWFKLAFTLNELEFLCLNKEELELYNKALTYNLVNSLQPIKQNDKDLNPELLLFPIDYSSPSDILEIVKQNEVGITILSNHIEVKQKRYAALLLEVEKSKQENSKFDNILLKINQDLALAEQELRMKSSELQSSIISTIESLSSSTELLLTQSDPIKFSSPIEIILSQSSNYTTLLSTFSNLIPSSTTPTNISISNLEIEELSYQISKLESQILFQSLNNKELTLEAVASKEFENSSVEELEVLLGKENALTSQVEKTFAESVEKRVRGEIERSLNLQKVKEIERTVSFINMLKTSIESELTLLIQTYNSLSLSYDLLINFQILSMAFISLLLEITSSSFLPTTPTSSSSPSGEVSTNLIDESLLYKAVEGLSKVPILNREDLKIALEEVEDRYISRTIMCEELVQKNQETSNLLKAHLNLYSPTSILSPISNSLEELIKKSSLKEKEWKILLSSEMIKNFEISKKDREALKRLELILREG